MSLNDELLAALERLTKNNSVSALIKSGQSDYDFAHEGMRWVKKHRQRMWKKLWGARLP